MVGVWIRSLASLSQSINFFLRSVVHISVQSLQTSFSNKSSTGHDKSACLRISWFSWHISSNIKSCPVNGKKSLMPVPWIFFYAWVFYQGILQSAVDGWTPSSPHTWHPSHPRYSSETSCGLHGSRSDLLRWYWGLAILAYDHAYPRYRFGFRKKICTKSRTFVIYLYINIIHDF